MPPRPLVRRPRDFLVFPYSLSYKLTCSGRSVFSDAPVGLSPLWRLPRSQRCPGALPLSARRRARPMSFFRPFRGWIALLQRVRLARLTKTATQRRPSLLQDRKGVSALRHARYPHHPTPPDTPCKSGVPRRAPVSVSRPFRFQVRSGRGSRRSPLSAAPPPFPCSAEPDARAALAWIPVSPLRRFDCIRSPHRLPDVSVVLTPEFRGRPTIPQMRETTSIEREYSP